MQAWDGVSTKAGASSKDGWMVMRGESQGREGGVAMGLGCWWMGVNIGVAGWPWAGPLVNGDGEANGHVDHIDGSIAGSPVKP